MTNRRLVGHGTGWPTEIEIMRELNRKVQELRRILVLVGVIGFLLGIMLVLSIVLATKPNCPTEDSCFVDYHNGTWHVIEGNPEDITMH